MRIEINLENGLIIHLYRWMDRFGYTILKKCTCQCGNQHLDELFDEFGFKTNEDAENMAIRTVKEYS